MLLLPPAPLTSCSFTLMNATKLHKCTNTEREKERDEKDIATLRATELSPCLVCTGPGVESCKMSPVSPDLSCCSRRGADRTLLCLGLVPSPQFLVRSPLSGLESSHLPFPLQRKKKDPLLSFFPGCFVSALLFLLFFHIHICVFFLGLFQVCFLQGERAEEKRKSLRFFGA